VTFKVIVVASMKMTAFCHHVLMMEAAKTSELLISATRFNGAVTQEVAIFILCHVNLKSQQELKNL
jgi:hypothetical protein